MTGEMEGETFEALVAKMVASTGMKPSECGFVLSRGPDRWWLSRRSSIYENDMATYSLRRLDEANARIVATEMRGWWRNERRLRGVVAAHDFLYGSLDGVERPYTADAVTMRHFAARGVDAAVFAHLMRIQIGESMPARSVPQHIDKVFSSFGQRRPEAFEPHCWRSGTTRLRAPLAVLGDIQFRLSDDAGGGLYAYFEIAPGTFWRGGRSPQLLLRGHDLPDTIIAAAGGRHATELVAHPSLEVEGLTISSVAREMDRYGGGVKRPRITVRLRKCTVDLRKTSTKAA